MKSCQKASIYLRGSGGRGGRNAIWQIPSLFIPLHQLFHNASSIGKLFPANYYQFLWSSYFAIEGVIWSTLFLFSWRWLSEPWWELGIFITFAASCATCLPFIALFAFCSPCLLLLFPAMGEKSTPPTGWRCWGSFMNLCPGINCTLKMPGFQGGDFGGKLRSKKKLSKEVPIHSNGITNTLYAK